MASATQPARRAEQAMLAYVSAAAGQDLAGITLSARADDEEVSANRLSVVCRVARRAEPEAETSGHWICEVTLRLTTHFGDFPGYQHDEAAGAVFDCLMSPDVVGVINAAAGGEPVTALLWVPPVDMTFDHSEHRRVTEMTGLLHIGLAPNL